MLFLVRFPDIGSVYKDASRPADVEIVGNKLYIQFTGDSREDVRCAERCIGIQILKHTSDAFDGMRGFGRKIVTDTLHALYINRIVLRFTAVSGYENLLS